MARDASGPRSNGCCSLCCIGLNVSRLGVAQRLLSQRYNPTLVRLQKRSIILGSQDGISRAPAVGEGPRGRCGGARRVNVILRRSRSGCAPVLTVPWPRTGAEVIQGLAMGLDGGLYRPAGIYGTVMCDLGSVMGFRHEFSNCRDSSETVRVLARSSRHRGQHLSRSTLALPERSVPTLTCEAQAAPLVDVGKLFIREDDSTTSAARLTPFREAGGTSRRHPVVAYEPPVTRARGVPRNRELASGQRQN